MMVQAPKLPENEAITLNLAEDTSKAQVLTDFRQAWHEAQTGQGIPVVELWEKLENELLADRTDSAESH
jgi:hypothetical protein